MCTGKLVVVGFSDAGALKNYYRINGMLPDRVIVFRDGVGDGQLETVHEHEVRQLLDCFKSVGEEYQYVLPLITNLYSSSFFTVLVFIDLFLSFRHTQCVTDALWIEPQCYCLKVF